MSSAVLQQLSAILDTLPAHERLSTVAILAAAEIETLTRRTGGTPNQRYYYLNHVDDMINKVLVGFSKGT